MTALISQSRLSPKSAPHKSTPHKSVQHKSAGIEHAHISASQLKSFSNCPLAWKLSRTRRPEFVPAALLFGSAFHAAAEKYYQARLEGREAEFPELLEAYDAKWRERAGEGGDAFPVKYGARADEEELRRTAGRMLEVFLARARERPGEVVAVEEPFEVELAPDLPPLRGRIDLIEIRSGPAGKNQLCLVDFKTAAKRPAEGDIDREQLDLYALAIRRTGLLGQLGLPLELRAEVITKTKEPEAASIPVPPSPRLERRAAARAREIYKGMAAGLCYPAPGWQCQGCGYQAVCAKWPDPE